MVKRRDSILQNVLWGGPVLCKPICEIIDFLAFMVYNKVYTQCRLGSPQKRPLNRCVADGKCCGGVVLSIPRFSSLTVFRRSSSPWCYPLADKTVRGDDHDGIRKGGVQRRSTAPDLIIVVETDWHSRASRSRPEVSQLFLSMICIASQRKEARI